MENTNTDHATSTSTLYLEAQSDIPGETCHDTSMNSQPSLVFAAKTVHPFPEPLRRLLKSKGRRRLKAQISSTGNNTHALVLHF